ncbi:unnamed protein product [Effrenium voratum]|nr:unnamed protein product [Effrenium voratum]
MTLAWHGAQPWSIKLRKGSDSLAPKGRSLPTPARWMPEAPYALGVVTALSARFGARRLRPVLVRRAESQMQRKMSKNLALSSVFLVSSGANKVLLRILLALVSQYAFMLGVLTNFVYIVVFGLQFKLALAASAASKTGACRRAASLKFASKGPGLRLLAGSGACEAAAFVLLPVFASLLPGSLMPVMSQGLLIFSMGFSAVLLQRRYDLLQGMTMAVGHT